ncbi:hypothetical protein C8Q75DRAFT_730975 [Abortiporus biennis]|nr:hypothetical protein C8Q75DRAFT_730975 [Abortiporus biennis]
MGMSPIPRRPTTLTTNYGLVISLSHRAKTPIIAGAISGSIVGAAWIIGFIIYFYKRHRREKRAKAAGFKGHREYLGPPKKQTIFVIPPDPAVIQGLAAPGQRIFEDPVVKHEPDSAHPHPPNGTAIPMINLGQEDDNTNVSDNGHGNVSSLSTPRVSSLTSTQPPPPPLPPRSQLPIPPPLRHNMNISAPAVLFGPGTITPVDSTSSQVDSPSPPVSPVIPPATIRDRVAQSNGSLESSGSGDTTASMVDGSMGSKIALFGRKT